MTPGFVPPPYPYDRLDRLHPLAERFPEGLIDLSVGTPTDAPTKAVVDALAHSGSERGYPSSIGSVELRQASSRWMRRRFGVDVAVEQIGAVIGTKEFVCSLPQWLRLRRPDRDTVLYPAVSYPTYAMGATVAGCRAVPVACQKSGALDLEAIDAEDASRALVLWSNSPANPTGALDDLDAVAEWGRANDVLVASDECYAEFTWSGDPRTVLAGGSSNVLAVHSLSKRSNLAGVRVGFYAGDADVVRYLQEVRKHAGMMVPGPAQAAAVAALDDDRHVEQQRRRYRRRLSRLAEILGTWSGRDIPLPDGGFYLWFGVGDAWTFAERLAAEGGALVSPGEFYGQQASEYVRVAAVQSDESVGVLARRLRSSDG